MNPHPNKASTRSWHFSSSGIGRKAPTSLLGKLLAVVLSLVLLTVVIAFSLVFLAIGAAVGLLVWGYLKYRAASLRRTLDREGYGAAPHRPGRTGGPAPSVDGARGRIIEGEARREDPSVDETERR